MADISTINEPAVNDANGTPKPGAGQGGVGPAGGLVPGTGNAALSPSAPTILPHQPDPLRHEGIREPVTEPPEVPVSPDDYDHLHISTQVPRPLPALRTETALTEVKLYPLPNIAGRGLTPPPAPPPAEPGLVAELAASLAARVGALSHGDGHFRSEKHAAVLDTIMAFARRTTAVTNDDVERLTGIHHAQAANLLRELVRQGRLERFGRFKHTVYRPPA